MTYKAYTSNGRKLVCTIQNFRNFRKQGVVSEYFQMFYQLEFQLISKFIKGIVTENREPIGNKEITNYVVISEHPIRN